MSETPDIEHDYTAVTEKGTLLTRTVVICHGCRRPKAIYFNGRPKRPYPCKRCEAKRS